MNMTARSLTPSNSLIETADRLIDALGPKAAIAVCRSNYWHGVLHIVLDRQAIALGVTHDG
jgi:hypothetical protein